MGRTATPGLAASSLRQERVSLLWPGGPPRRQGDGLTSGARADLDLDEVLRLLTDEQSRRERFVSSVLAELATDPEVIVYRQEAVTDLLEDVQLRERLAGALPGLTALTQERSHSPRDNWSVLLIARRLAELEIYVDVALRLRQALEAATIRSTALRGLLEHLIAVTDAPDFRSLQAQLPELRANLEQAGSITIGINLSRDLLPESAAIMSIKAEKIEGRGTLLERLFGGDSERRGITPLRLGDAGNIYSAENRLFRDLRKLLELVTAPVGQVIDRYTSINAQSLNTLEPELSFLLNGIGLIERLREIGLPVCRPEVHDPDERLTVLEDGYNVSLALRMAGSPAPEGEPAPQIVTNTIAFDGKHGRVWILTGPNRGGKTTYTRAVGLAHVLFQAGLYVPARSARMSPVDMIYTHFPSQEGAQLGMGRLDEEAERLAAIFRAATPHSLILLNEVLAGTSAIEALGLALDAVRGLRLLGVRAIYTTHLHELAASVDAINAGTSGDSTVASLVADVEGDGVVIGTRHRRTFRILPGPPRGVSYASEIAEQHGISFGQLASLLEQRGVIRQIGSGSTTGVSPAE